MNNSLLNHQDMDSQNTSDQAGSKKKMSCCESQKKGSVVKEIPTHEPITVQPNALSDVQSSKTKEEESAVKNEIKAKISLVGLNTQPDKTVPEEDEQKPNDEPVTFMTKLGRIFTPNCMTITAIVTGVAVCITGTTLLAIYVPKCLAGGGAVAAGGAGAGGAACCSGGGGGGSSKCDCDDCCRGCDCRGCDCRGCGDCCVLCLPSPCPSNGCGTSYYGHGCCRGSDDCCDCCCVCCFPSDNKRNPDEDDQGEEGQVHKKKKSQVDKKEEVCVTQPIGHPSAHNSEELRH